MSSSRNPGRGAFRGGLTALLAVCVGSVVLLADTIGHTTLGVNVRSLNGAYRCYTGTLPSDVDAGDYDVVTKIEDTATGDTFRALLVDDDNATVIAYSDEYTDVSTVGNKTFSGGTFASVGLTNGAVIRICVGSNSAAGANAYFSDDGAATLAYSGLVSSITAEPPTLSGSLSTDAARPYSIWLDYTPAAGGGGGSSKRRMLLGVGE
jgi:hypothetical protein